MKNVLITGAAGFIGFHAAKDLLSKGIKVVGIDNFTPYYEVELKKARLAILSEYKNFEFHSIDFSDMEALTLLAGANPFSHILHLGAQAGVRYSVENPQAYIASNLVGHSNILEIARHSDSLDHLVYASSSSVYGNRSGKAFSEQDIVRNPVSLYAATKISGEMLSESYKNLYGLLQTGLRFFTVYGPWGRPDMAYFIFTDKIRKGETITLFAPDEMIRDFSYVDDIVGVLPTILQTPPKSGHEVYNLGRGEPQQLQELVSAVEEACGQKGGYIIKDKQNGDVNMTYADISKANADFGYKPVVSIKEGVSRFVKWHLNYYPNL